MLAPGHMSFLPYTSGSTGRPKGVVLSHYSHLWAMSQRVRRPVPQGQRSLVAAPLYHMNGLAMCQTTFSQGDTVVLLPQFTTRGYIEAAAKHKVGFLTSVPTMIAMLLREKELLEKTDLSSVKVVRMGSAPLSQSLIDQAQRVFPNALVSNAYGTTEAGPVVFGPHPQGIKQPPLSPGYRHAAVELRLTRDGREVQDEGVLEQKCGALMTRYRKLPEATAKVKARHSRASLQRTALGSRVICDDPDLLYEEHPDAYKAVEPVIDALERFGAARRWGEIADVHGSLDATRARLTAIYDDWWRRWRMPAAW